MGDIEGSVGDKRHENGNRQAPEDRPGIPGKVVDGFDDGDGAPRTLWQRSSAGTGGDQTAVFAHILCSQDGTGDKGGNEDDEEEDGVGDAQVLEQSPRGRMAGSGHDEQTVHEPRDSIRGFHDRASGRKGWYTCGRYGTRDGVRREEASNKYREEKRETSNEREGRKQWIRHMGV